MNPTLAKQPTTARNHSNAYITGIEDAIRYLRQQAPLVCPYPPRSNDAWDWLDGNDEGFNMWEREIGIADHFASMYGVTRNQQA